ncbi:MAG: alkaline phosphatase family protein [Candidatus Cybelea sp.]
MGTLSRYALSIGAAALFAGCGGSQSSITPRAGTYQSSSGSQSPIQHVILMVQENRTFNDFFATYPGTDGTTTGVIKKSSTCHVKKTHTVTLKEVPLAVPQDLVHRYQAYWTAYDSGNMDDFDDIKLGNGTPECKYPYQYTDPADIQPYWNLAQQYALAEHMFTTQGSTSFAAHQDLIRGSSQISSSVALVNDPSGIPWGCDAPPGKVTSLITENGHYEGGQGPFPCSNQFPPSYNYNTLRDVLDAQGVSWKYYVLPLRKNYGGLMTAFDVISSVRYGPEWKTNIATPQTKIFDDIYNGTLPAMSWVIPDKPDSDHPGGTIDNGPSWVASVVNAVGQSSYWASTAIIVVWDDWGGLYDNVPPAQHGFGGLGFRVPALIISPYAKAGYISQTNYEFGSILKYIENNWNLGSLGTTDKTSASIVDCFDYSQRPLKFRKIDAKYSEQYFRSREPSGLPIDNDM